MAELNPSALTPGPDHRAPQATQVSHPWVTTARTVVQTGLPALLVFLVIVPEIIQVVLDGMGETLPDGLRLWLLGAAAFVTALSGTLARIFAIPGVNNALAALGLKAPTAG